MSWKGGLMEDLFDPPARVPKEPQMYNRKAGSKYALFFDGTIESAEDICRWVNQYSDPLDDPRASFILSARDAKYAHNLIIWGDEHDCFELSPNTWLVRTESTDEFYPASDDNFRMAYDVH